MTAASWVEGADGSPYGVQNLPYGVFVTWPAVPTVGVRVADFVLDLAAPSGSVWSMPAERSSHRR